MEILDYEKYNKFLTDNPSTDFSWIDEDYTRQLLDRDLPLYEVKKVALSWAVFMQNYLHSNKLSSLYDTTRNTLTFISLEEWELRYMVSTLVQYWTSGNTLRVLHNIHCGESKNAKGLASCTWDHFIK